MKKILIALIAAISLVSCGVGSYSVSSGKEGKSAISFTSDTKKPVEILVSIDGKEYNVQTVTQKTYRVDRKIKETTLNTIYLENGKHTVQVSMDGNKVYEKQIFLSAEEHRIVEL